MPRLAGQAKSVSLLSDSIARLVEMSSADAGVVRNINSAIGLMMLEMELDKGIIMTTKDKQLVVFITLGFIPMVLGITIGLWKLAYAFGKQITVVMLK